MMVKTTADTIIELVHEFPNDQPNAHQREMLTHEYNAFVMCITECGIILTGIKFSNAKEVPERIREYTEELPKYTKKIGMLCMKYVTC